MLTLLFYFYFQICGYMASCSTLASGHSCCQWNRLLSDVINGVRWSEHVVHNHRLLCCRQSRQEAGHCVSERVGLVETGQFLFAVRHSCWFLGLILNLIFLNPLPPVGHIWDVMLVWRKGNINKNCLCVTVLCTIIMVHKDTSRSYRSVDCIGLWSCLV